MLGKGKGSHRGARHQDTERSRGTALLILNLSIRTGRLYASTAFPLGKELSAPTQQKAELVSKPVLRSSGLEHDSSVVRPTA